MVDKDIDEVLRAVSYLLAVSDFARVDEMIESIDYEWQDLDVVVALLTATLPARDNLSKRSAAIDQLESRLSGVASAEEVEHLIANLRG